MPRGTERNSRKAKATKSAQRLPKTTGESAMSKSYAKGNTVGYAYRIRGPIAPVETRVASEEDLKAFGVSR